MEIDNKSLVFSVIALTAFLVFRDRISAHLPSFPTFEERNAASSDGTPLILDRETFKSTVDSPSPVLVAFHATWCGPCRQLAPVIDEIASQNAGFFVVGKVDIDQQPALAQRYNIRSVPTLLIFKNGEVVEELKGVYPKGTIESMLEQVRSTR